MHPSDAASATTLRRACAAQAHPLARTGADTTTLNPARLPLDEWTETSAPGKRALTHAVISSVQSDTSMTTAAALAPSTAHTLPPCDEHAQIWWM